MRVVITLRGFQTLPRKHELVAEKEKYKDIGDDLDTAFVELILKE
ncbi:tropomyosin-2 isoform 1 [Danaus plexippus plexippus]|uniref:Tropomyosin-2 isoform 1 n=1 Tax=Danaus plexippus plexippus TaxID=278856 RepID=A0A212F7L8_DANPL|nr:tropomyosin-2 isoform 1 [Danaus plexippus plexippus]